MLGILTLNLIQSKQEMSQVFKWLFWNFNAHVVVFFTNSKFGQLRNTLK